MDRIHIRDLTLRTYVGIDPEEQEKKQEVTLNITLFADLKKAGRTDDIADTVNYRSIKKQIVETVESSRFSLIERLAEAVSEIVLKDSRVRKAEVTVDKPGALRFARSVAVTIERGQNG
jgi:dihydroneopterin aldolase/D-erythro-7,8-dihydroneopterin triphosphate epimerase